MKSTEKVAQCTPADHETRFRFNPADSMWHAWSSRPEHIEKLVGSQWRLAGVDADGASFTAPEYALQICVAEGKKLTGKALRKREADLYRAQVNAIIERRHKNKNGK